MFDTRGDVQRARYEQRGSVRNYFGVIGRGRSYLNVLYLGLGFPLGIFYFVVLITGLSTGLGTAAIGVGVLLLAVMVYVWRAFAAFEREMAIWWLKVEINPMSVRMPQREDFFKQARTLLTNETTWKGLVFVFAKFPIGIGTFIVITVGSSVSLALLLSPLAYAISTLVYHVSPFTADSYTLTFFGFVRQNEQFDPINFAKTLLDIPLGIVLFALFLHIGNGMAWLLGQFARTMLGMSDVNIRLAEARSVAMRESERAQRSEQSRRELIVNVGHDLRTPIASIRGHIESIMMANESGTALPPETSQAYLTIASREAERLGLLVDDLLALARADAHELHLVLTPFAAGEVVVEVTQTLAPLALRERQVTVISQVEPETPLVLADRQRLTQVLQNLVRNAITYTPSGGIVSISVAPSTVGMVELVVADTGMGIPPEELDRVFERFYRTDTSRTRASGGFGLGLAIVRDLVGAMGGTVSVTSVVDAGSRFTITLRVAPPALPEA